MRPAGYVVTGFIQALLFYATIPFSFSAPNPLFEDTPVNCCSRSKEAGALVASCTRGSSVRCPLSSSIVAVSESKNTVVLIRNQAGWLRRGENGLCIEVLDRRTSARAALINLRLDVTLRMGHIEAVRAVAFVTPKGPGFYCGSVTLPFAGRWKLTLSYRSATTKGKIVFLETIS